MCSGFIKLHRKIMEWEWYHDTNCVRLFLHILLKANYKDKKWQGIEIKRGQFITGLNVLSEETELSVRQIRTALDKLKSTQEIAIQSTNRFSIITVVNYEEYQGIETETTSQATNKRQTDDNQTTTTKKLKKEKNKDIDIGENVNNNISDFELALSNFEEMRNKIKKPMTEKAKELLLSKLDKLAKTEKDKIAILEQSILNCWQGVFELKSNNTKQTVNTDTQLKPTKEGEPPEGYEWHPSYIWNEKYHWWENKDDPRDNHNLRPKTKMG